MSHAHAHPHTPAKKKKKIHFSNIFFIHKQLQTRARLFKKASAPEKEYRRARFFFPSERARSFTRRLARGREEEEDRVNSFFLFFLTVRRRLYPEELPLSLNFKNAFAYRSSLDTQKVLFD